MHPMLTTAIKAARKAGAIINRAAPNLDRLTVHTKSDRDYVTEVDQSAEHAIIETLLEAYPNHGILAEETGARPAVDGRADEYQWVIDPLDGTTNFLHGLPQYAVSIALRHKGVVSQAVVYDPVNNELYTASRGRGAFLNDRRLRVSKRDKLEDCLVGTGFPFREFGHVETYINMFRDVMKRTSGIRRPGSAALDLAYVAAGRYDAFWEIGLNPRDLAAGSLLVQEAGGLVGDLAGNETWFDTGNILAATPKIFGQMVQTLKPHLSPDLK